jgi:hypothetical protein
MALPGQREEVEMKKRSMTALFLCVCAALALSLCVLVLAGCGGNNEESSDNGTSSGNTGTTGIPQGDAAQLAACQGNLRMIDAAARVYEASNGKTAPNIQALVPSFLPKVPTEPMGGTYSLRGGKAVCSKGHTY